MDHATKQMCIDGEECSIDIQIIPAVLWLNELPGVKTFASCEGDGGGAHERPYIAFTCSELSSLEKIAESIEEGCGYDVVYGCCCLSYYKNLHFVLEFSSKERLRDFYRDKLRI